MLILYKGIYINFKNLIKYFVAKSPSKVIILMTE